MQVIYMEDVPGCTNRVVGINTGKKRKPTQAQSFWAQTSGLPLMSEGAGTLIHPFIDSFLCGTGV
jgi:hypothetical protein